MKIGIQSNAYATAEGGYRTDFEKMASHGYNCADYGLLALATSPLYTVSDEEFKAYFTEVRETAAKSGVEIYQMHGLWPTVNHDLTEEDREKTKQYYIKEIKAAHYLGCRRLVIHPFTPGQYDDAGDDEFTYEINLKLLRELSVFAKEYDVIVCVENLPFEKREIARVDGVLRLIREVDSPYVKMCLDTGHANIFSNDLAADVRKIGSDLEALHVHDNFGWCDAHLLPYCGTINWEPFFDALKEIGYDGCMSLETKIGAGMPKGIKEVWQKNLGELAIYMAKRASGELPAPTE